MRTDRRVLGWCLTAAFLLGGGVGIQAQGTNAVPKRVVPPKPEKKAPPAEPTPQENWLAAATPGPQHKVLENFVGRWKTHASIVIDPSKPAEESDGTADGTMLLGGRYVQVTHKGTLQGQPFEGMSIMGYDNIAKKFVSIWFDNMGTALVHYDGTYDKNLKRLMTGARFVDPMTRKPVHVRAVTSFVDATSFTYEEFMPGPDGKDRRTMKITFKKV